MRRSVYQRLAWDGIKKNQRLYGPYILTGVVMVMMYYILSYLIESPALEQMPGGSVLMSLLPMGAVVIAVFSLLFLFYTNSFLLKQRYYEFGLYNILGMDKRNLSKVMFWETLDTALMVLAAGLGCGIAFSKLAELCLLNLLRMEVSFQLSVGMASFMQTLLVYGGIYLLLLGNAWVRIGRTRPLELMKQSQAGEKIPRRIWILAVLGILALGIAYYLALSIKEPLTALFTFFAAVLLVILGTYLLMIAGSVAFCRLLQKNKTYYYKPNHFVSVSSMVYRMKRNGAGLASICILLTMVLVMLTSSASLYFGEEEALQKRYPDGLNIKVYYSELEDIEAENLDLLQSKISACSGGKEVGAGLRTCIIPGMFNEDGMIVNVENVVDFSAASYDNVGYLCVNALEDYNERTGKNETLLENECLIFCDRLTTQWETFETEYGTSYKVKERLSDYPEDGDQAAMTMPTVYMVVKDLRAFAEPFRNLRTSAGEPFINYVWSCGFDMDTAESEIETAKAIRSELESQATKEGSTILTYYAQSREMQRDAFYEMYGSLFFLGIMLSIVFLLAAVLIIYYKQISEGYEDQKRFAIMQNVGMTKQDIRKSINSQMLTIFFLPLILAGLHLVFAYPFVSKILVLFAFDNTRLNILVNVLCFAAFGILYGIIYKLTSGSYYAIVSEKKE